MQIFIRFLFLSSHSDLCLCCQLHQVFNFSYQFWSSWVRFNTWKAWGFASFVPVIVFFTIRLEFKSLFLFLNHVIWPFELYFRFLFTFKCILRFLGFLHFSIAFFKVIKRKHFFLLTFFHLFRWFFWRRFFWKDILWNCWIQSRSLFFNCQSLILIA